MDDGEEIAAASPEETRAALAGLRGYTQVRHIFVQMPTGDRASTLAKFVSERKHRALLLYLMLLMCWPWLSVQKHPLPAATWVRALTTRRGLTWSPSTLSRAWSDLEGMGLIERESVGRGVRVVPRREDGESEYEAPGGRRDRLNTYFVLPDSFWRDELFSELTLPGLAMLLLIAKETSDKTEVWFPLDKLPEWYGIKRRTAQNGISDLEAHGLLHRRYETVKAPLSPTGKTTRIWYSLTGAYGHESRRALQARAAKERRRKAAGGKRRKVVKAK